MQERSGHPWRTTCAALALVALAACLSPRPRVDGWTVAMSLAAVASGASWAWLAAIRGGERRVGFAVQALAGGAAAFGVAVAVFEVAAWLGLDARWERLVHGDAAAFLVAGAVGLVEEGAKLAGVLVVVRRGAPTRTVVTAGFGVAAGFSALETLVILAGETRPAAFVRAALGPVAHGLLLAPAALAAAPALRSRRPALALAGPLAASAALHGLGDLSLALSGGAGYALTLAAPALALFAWAQRRRAARAAGRRRVAASGATD